MATRKKTAKRAANAAPVEAAISIPINQTSAQVQYSKQRELDGARQTARELADKIRIGAPLENWQRAWVAATLNQWADELPRVAPKRRGRPVEIDPGNAAFEFAFLVVHQGKSEPEAISALADRHGKDVETIRKALSKYREAAVAYVRSGLRSE